MSPTSLTTSTTQRLRRQIRSPRTCVTRNSTVRPSGKRYLHHCSFRSEKNRRTEDKLITPRKKVCCQLSLFSHTRTERPVHELSSCQKRNSSREMENERFRILLERQKEQILSEVITEADSDGRSFQELNGIIESLRREIDHTILPWSFPKPGGFLPGGLAGTSDVTTSHLLDVGGNVVVRVRLTRKTCPGDSCSDRIQCFQRQSDGKGCAPFPP